jgi:hypothetical protein
MDDAQANVQTVGFFSGFQLLRPLFQLESKHLHDIVWWLDCRPGLIRPLRSLIPNACSVFLESQLMGRVRMQSALSPDPSNAFLSAALL